MFNPLSIVKRLRTPAPSIKPESPMPRVKYYRNLRDTVNDRKIYTWTRLDPDDSVFTHVGSKLAKSTNYAPFLPLNDEFADRIRLVDINGSKFLVIDHEMSSTQFVALLGSLSMSGLVDKKLVENFETVEDVRVEIPTENAKDA